MKRIISLIFCGLIASCASHYKSAEMVDHGFDGQKAFSTYSFNAYGVKAKETYTYYGDSFAADINQSLVTQDIVIELPKSLKDIIKIKRAQAHAIDLKLAGLVDEEGNFFMKMALGLSVEIDSGFDKFVNMRSTDEGGVILSLRKKTAKFCQVQMDEKFCIMEAELTVPDYVKVSYQ